MNLIKTKNVSGPTTSPAQERAGLATLPHKYWPFTMRSSMGTITHERVVELRRAREIGQTGEISDYNFLSSLLPQNTRV